MRRIGVSLPGRVDAAGTSSLSAQVPRMKLKNPARGDERLELAISTSVHRVRLTPRRKRRRLQNSGNRQSVRTRKISGCEQFETAEKDCSTRKLSGRNT